MSDCDRILAYCREHGSVNTTTFMAPNVPDGGKPITRTPARIIDLKDQRGCEFEKVVEKNRTATYYLVSDPERGWTAPAFTDPAAGDPEPSERPVAPSYAARNEDRSPASEEARADASCGDLGSLFDADTFHRAAGAYDQEAA